MFFESRGSLIVAAILIVAGCYQVFSSRSFAEAASREASAVGVITYVSGGRGSIYYFRFVADGRQRSGEGASCHTPLSNNGCGVGEPVRVYYDPAQIVETALQEYGERARGMLFVGVCFILAGLVVVVLHLIFSRMEKDSDGGDETYGGDCREDAPLHVTPDA
ncbi:MAG TPA: DUF3592 domain-containing protein [Terracidiphilus sp.]|jgi:hypothetical protein|nr:DUF3592 domain-containing protein [Terracidiphilus sp.]